MKEPIKRKALWALAKEDGTISVVLFTRRAARNFRKTGERIVKFVISRPVVTMKGIDKKLKEIYDNDTIGDLAEKRHPLISYMEESCQ